MNMEMRASQDQDASVEYSVKELLGTINDKLGSIDSKLAQKADTSALEKVAAQIAGLNTRVEQMAGRMPARLVDEHAELLTDMAIAKRTREDMEADIRTLFSYHDETISNKVLLVALIPSVISFVYTAWAILHPLVK